LIEYRLSRPPSTEPIRPAPHSPAQKKASLFVRMTNDPFERALLYALRRIGKELFLLGGTRCEGCSSRSRGARS
jgi:hypothetical protein